MCDQGKIEYASRNQAHVAARKSGARNVLVYQHEGHFHFTRSQPRPPKHIALPKEQGPKPYSPSLRKLRAWLEAQQRTITAQFRRLEASEKKLAAEHARANAQKRKSEAANAIELEAIAAMTNALRRV